MGENNDLEKIERILCQLCDRCDWKDWGWHKDSCEALKDAKRNLSSQGVVRIAPEQTAPKNPYPQDYQSVNGDLFERYQEAQQDMLRAGFIKTVLLMEV